MFLSLEMEYQTSLISLSDTSDDDYHTEKCSTAHCSNYTHMLLSQLSDTPLVPFSCSSDIESDFSHDELSELDSVASSSIQGDKNDA